MKQETCIFCKIATGEIPSQTLFEDDYFRVILDVEPATKGHALILVKEHYRNLYDLPLELTGKVFELAQKVALRMKEKWKCDGINIVQNNEAVSGQTVFHFHLHIIPRYENDEQHISWRPLNFKFDVEELNKSYQSK